MGSGIEPTGSDGLCGMILENIFVKGERKETVIKRHGEDGDGKKM